MQRQGKFPHTSKRLRCDRLKSQLVLPTVSCSESTFHIDIPPNRLPNDLLKASHSPGLECEETMDSYQIPLPVIDVEEAGPEEGFSNNSLTNEGKEVGSWTVKEKVYINSLLEKETEYACNPFYLQLHQPYITPLMRAILLDWMMEVCSEFTLKRETYYLSVSYVDRYLSVCAEVKKAEFQLLGLTALFLASKTEEICTPKIADFARSADNGYSQGQIKAMEMRVLRSLSWRLFPPTVFNWLSLCMSLWDDFLISRLSVPLEGLESTLISFKQANQYSYKRYRETVEVLDAAYLDAGVLHYSPRHITAGLLYLSVSKYFYSSNYRLFSYIKHENSIGKCDFEEKQDSLAVAFGDGKWERSGETAGMKWAQEVQELFEEFSRRALEVRSIEEIYPSVAFLHEFMELEVGLELPIACKVLPKARIESHYEDFLAFQTHNPSNVPFISPRLKANRSK